jgi:fructoselysine-6-P-deglycase FrlB-like protein
VDAHAFAADLERKPETLDRLADALRTGDPWAGLPAHADPHVVLVGMGSSHYASSVVAARLRAAGVHAVAELASSDLLPRVGPRTVVVAVSATGGSRETLDALDRLGDGVFVAALTNSDTSALAERADLVVPMRADREAGGVACRTYAHTLALLLALEARLTGRPVAEVADVVAAAAVATRDLLDRRPAWLDRVTELVAGPDGTHVAAPARRLGSAQQSALMLREGPRRPAVGCETGDWAHVDVYLTRNTDYRLLLLAGSRWEDGVLEWTVPRGTTVVAVGGELEHAALTLRYAGDDVDDVRLLTETTVAELVAARLWTRQQDGV